MELAWHNVPSFYDTLKVVRPGSASVELSAMQKTTNTFIMASWDKSVAFAIEILLAGSTGGSISLVWGQISDPCDHRDGFNKRE